MKKIAIFQAFQRNWFFVMADVGNGWAPVDVDGKPVRFGSPGVGAQWVKAWFPDAECTFKRERHMKRTSIVREYHLPS